MAFRRGAMRPTTERENVEVKKNRRQRIFEDGGVASAKYGCARYGMKTKLASHEDIAYGFVERMAREYS